MIIVSTTLKELESGCGQAVTGGGSLLPMSRCDPAGQPRLSLPGGLRPAHRHPAVSGVGPRRTASAGQRIVLHAKDRGCTRPGCTVPGYWCQVHHAETDWADDGQTNIDEAHPGLRPRQPAGQTRRLAHPKTYIRRGYASRSRR